MKNIEKQLLGIDLSASEILIYLDLLEFGESETRKIAGRTGITQTNCYGVLKNLQQKGFIQKQHKKGISSFFPNNPSVITSILEEKKQNAENFLIPNLISLFKSQENKPIIKFYEGKEQVKEIFTHMYNADELLGFASTNKLHQVYPKFFNVWRAELKKRGIILKDILTTASKKDYETITKPALGGLVDCKLIPSKYSEVPTDILVWNENIALISLEEPIFGTLIKNKHLAETFKIMHRIMWNAL